MKEYNKNYYHSNKERELTRTRKWKQENRDKMNVRKRDRQKERRLEDPVFRLRQNVSNSVVKALNGTRKKVSLLEALPYSIQELRDHLEKQFQPEWSWDNYGTVWNIDHIIPQSKLLYDNVDHPNFLKCWALENLRPLNALENSTRRDNEI